MSRLIKKHRHKKIGAPPGTLIYTGDKALSNIKFHLIEYDSHTFFEKKSASLSDCLKVLSTPKPTWINVTGLNNPEAVSALGQHFKINQLVMEDILNTGQRPKCEDYKEFIYIVLRIFRKKNGDEKFEDNQLSVVLGKDFIITFIEADEDIFEPVRVRLRKEGSRMRSFGCDYLAYAIIDMVVDHTFSLLENFDEELEKFEASLFAQPDPNHLYKLQIFKRNIALLRKNIWPLREVVSGLERKDNVLITDNTRFFMHDVHDHTILMIETIEGFRDILAGLHDLYLSSINLRLNEIMKVLTIVATIFVPLTFIASIYGMNFDYMPELREPYGYPFILLFMLTLASIMLFLFKRKKWI